MEQEEEKEEGRKGMRKERRKARTHITPHQLIAHTHARPPPLFFFFFYFFFCTLACLAKQANLLTWGPVRQTKEWEGTSLPNNPGRRAEEKEEWKIVHSTANFTWLPQFCLAPSSLVVVVAVCAKHFSLQLSTQPQHIHKAQPQHTAHALSRSLNFAHQCL
tara:strand:- start:94 stop:576 length:483 start_codon:yes stop_codon:yes gene_type:complete